jgi:hypothetical protein
MVIISGVHPEMTEQRQLHLRKRKAGDQKSAVATVREFHLVSQGLTFPTTDPCVLAGRER